jgi:hypothetical protein
MVGAMSTHQIFLVNLEDTLKTGKIEPCMVYTSPLKYQTRHVEAFPNGNGYCVTSIEGRCGVKNVDFRNLQEKYDSIDFNFKCHRKDGGSNIVYPVHQVAFNRKYETFMTVGGDGAYFTWDK